jgi:hypothetical protein
MLNYAMYDVARIELAEREREAVRFGWTRRARPARRTWRA